MRRPEAGARPARPRDRTRAGGSRRRPSTSPATIRSPPRSARSWARRDGRLDVLVNNAGYYPFGALEETSPDELRAQLETNVVGVQRVTRAVLPAMRARRAGTVVTLGSVSGRVAVPMVGPYHASKWALEGMIEAWRLELIPFGVRVVLIEPGPYAHRAARQRTAGRGRGRRGAPTRRCWRATGARPPSCRARRPRPLVDVIERAATARTPDLRWPVGPDVVSAGPAARVRARPAVRMAHADRVPDSRLAADSSNRGRVRARAL